ncbi:MAG TPA: hypothetical protein VNQ76_01375 [Planctomicrobium sp.]|nr:hypothetical protein [Planctomicrobium sp.]
MIQLSAIFVLLLGCSGKAEKKPKTIPVSGTVYYQGKPLPKGDVSFEPEQSADAIDVRPATGRIDSNGRYQMSTYVNGDGVVPGNYRVRVVSYKDGGDSEDIASRRIMAIPLRYGNSKNSGLTISIPEEARREVQHDFTLTD